MFNPSHHLSFDHHTTASDFLSMVKHEWDARSLASPAFDGLLAELANDQAQKAFKPLAALVEEDGLELWQIDFFEDTAHVALVPAAQVDAFRAYWTKNVLDDPDAGRHFAPSLRRIQPQKKSLPKSASARSPAARPFPIETVILPDRPDIGIDRPTAFLRSPYGDHPDNGKYFDFSTWPPAPLPLPGFDDDRDFARRWRPACRSGERDVWYCRDLENKEEDWFRLAQIDDIEAWSPAWLGGGARLPGYRPAPKPMGDAFIHASDDDDGRGYEVWCVTRDGAACWYRSASKLQVFPFPDAMRCVIVEGDSRFAIADGPVEPDRLHRVPKPFYDTDTGIVALDGDRMVYFAGTKTRLRMHLVNIADLSSRSCVLEHFGHSGRHDGKAYRTFGRLEVRQGHGDWLILNHRSNQFGTIDIALMWNCVTDETFVVEQGDIPLRQPTIVYQRALDRYLALQGDRVALLPPFDTMYDGKQKTVLRWQPD